MAEQLAFFPMEVTDRMVQLATDAYCESSIYARPYRLIMSKHMRKALEAALHQKSPDRTHGKKVPHG